MLARPNPVPKNQNKHCNDYVSYEGQFKLIGIVPFKLWFMIHVHAF